MRLTVAVCTWNRSRLLARTLEEMTRLRVPDAVEWELIVVNNNCTDDTDEVLGRFEGRLPLRRVFEPEAGQSHARNAASREATGDYVLWTDDDVLVDPGWLEAYWSAFRRWPDASVFGGPIRPWFEGTPPRWLEVALPMVEGAYAIRDLGPEPVPLGHDTYPFGANMAMATDALRRFPFDPELGLQPNRNTRGDEMVLIRQMLAEGESGWWVPEATVRHYIPHARQSLRYLHDYYYGAGKLLARIETLEGRSLFGRPLWLWKQAVRHEAAYRLLRLFAPADRWVAHLAASRLSWGQIRGARRGERTDGRLAGVVSGEP